MSVAPAADARPAVPLDRASLLTLLAGNLLLEIGVGFFFPILPIFLSRRGASAGYVGAVIAAGVVAKAIAQYPAGRLTDRYGRRPVLVFSLALYTACFVAYLAPVPLIAFVGIRFTQALTIGAYIPAANAAIADLVPSERRGWAYGQMRATEMAGLLVGPVLGGLVAGFDLEAVLAAAAAICSVATVLLLRLPRGRREAAEAVSAPGLPTVRPSVFTLVRHLTAAMLIGAAIYYTIGTYDSVWSLYMLSRGGSTFQVGLSFAVYALPVMIVASLFGGRADRLGFRWAGAAALLAYSFFNWLYPLLTQPWLLISTGFAEGAATALAAPALSAEVSRRAPPGAQGMTQGVYATVLSVALAAGSLLGGLLFTLGPRPAFWTSAAVCALALIATVALRLADRRRSPGPRHARS